MLITRRKLCRIFCLGYRSQECVGVCILFDEIIAINKIIVAPLGSIIIILFIISLSRKWGKKIILFYYVLLLNTKLIWFITTHKALFASFYPFDFRWIKFEFQLNFNKINLHGSRSFSRKFEFYGSIEYGKLIHFCFFLFLIYKPQQHRPGMLPMKLINCLLIIIWYIL